MHRYFSSHFDIFCCFKKEIAFIRGLFILRKASEFLLEIYIVNFSFVHPVARKGEKMLDKITLPQALFLLIFVLLVGIVLKICHIPMYGLMQWNFLFSVE